MDFAELFKKVDPRTRRSLLDFRAKYPPKSLRLDGYDLEYVVLGEGEKSVLFLHGMAGSYDIWWQQMTVLSQGYKVVGVSYPPADNLEGMSQGVLAVLDAEGIGRANMVGSSLGGYLLQYLMATHPERIEKAVPANTFPPNDILRRKNARLIRMLPFLPDWLVMKAFRKNFVNRIYPAAGYSELVLAYLLEQVSGRMSKAQITARAKAVIEPFAPPDPEASGIPVMIIESDNDPLVEEALRKQLKAAYPSARVHTLKGGGHFPYLNMPDVYTKLLLDFLEA